MSRTWSAIVVAVAGGFILTVAALSDLRTPNAVIWEPSEHAGLIGESADNLVLQDVEDAALWASDGLSIYRSENDVGFLKVHDVKPPFGAAWTAYSRTLRELLGFEDAIEVFPLSRDHLLVFVGGEIQRVDLKSGTAETVHRLRYYGWGEGRGVMPFGITRDPEGRIYYGEYVTRRLEGDETVALFRSDENGENFKIVYEFPALVVRHIHAVQWDSHGQVLWMGTGDGDEQSRVGYSKDFGETFLWVGQESQDFRTVNFVFAEDHVAWLSDTISVPSRVVRWHRHNWEIETSPLNLPGHGHFLQPIGQGFSIGTTAEEAVTLWLVDPELGLDRIAEWQPEQGLLPRFSTIRLARGRRQWDDRLYLSPLRVGEQGPSIFRLTVDAAFAAAGRELPEEPSLPTTLIGQRDR